MAKKSKSKMKSLSQIKDEICEIGRRIYNKGFAAGNDGNISYRLGPNKVLCTPTLMSKGFMKPSDLCIVDMDGNHLQGKRKRSSEILLHLTIMKERPDVNSVVHCHPPHATAFAVAREPIPQAVLPEVEIFLGDVPTTVYETPGTQKFADTVLEVVKHSSVIILANHGVVSFGETIEQAYWWTEILDAYCRILILAKQLGGVHYLTGPQTRSLLEAKQTWGFGDARLATRFAITRSSAGTGKRPASPGGHSRPHRSKSEPPRRPPARAPTSKSSSRRSLSKSAANSASHGVKPRPDSPW